MWGSDPIMPFVDGVVFMLTREGFVISVASLGTPHLFESKRLAQNIGGDGVKYIRSVQTRTLVRCGNIGTKGLFIS